MSHPAGERLHCDECGAEIVFTKACNCPEREPKTHSNMCCNKEMRVVAAGASAGSKSPGAGSSR